MLNRQLLLQRLVLPLTIAGLTTSFAHAALTELSDAPLVTSAPLAVLPNLMLILDNSGSMGWTHMPDTVEKFGRDTLGNPRYGYRSAHCNGVYYNPDIIYHPPVRADGSSYPNSRFTAAWKNGYDTSRGTVDLSTSFYAYGNGQDGTDNTLAGAGTTDLENRRDTLQAAYYYVYTGTQTDESQKRYHDTNSTFYRECASTVGSTPGRTVFTRVTVSATSGPSGRADERTNFANWFSYYRTRMLMMKTSTGRAFSNIGDRYRVGYMTLNNGGSPALAIRTFDNAQRTTWYSNLYAATPSGGTPLRQALSWAGQMYAGRRTSIHDVNVGDPVQYSCQKNFTLLSTDGYWNDGAGTREDNRTAIGNEDGTEPRPYNDGYSASDVYRATLTIGGSGSTSVTGITVNGQQIMSGATTSSTTSSTVASRIVTAIENCRTTRIGNCTVTGYRATRSNNTITIEAPASLGPITVTPVVTKSGSKTVTVTPFAAQPVVDSAGTSGTLADVAMYYYKTDLRTEGPLATNNVLPGGDDDATHQHMTTFTLGLGARGRMVYSPTYKTDEAGDYAAVRDGLTASSSVCNWQTAGTTCTWPAPRADRIETIDDLWHAAVNGRGTYFSATDPASLSTGLTAALQSINAMTSDAAAATTSNPNLTEADNFMFSSTFRSEEWSGQLERRQINPLTGEEADTADWHARELIDSTPHSERNIYTFSPTATNKLRAFTWANLTTDERAYFTVPYISSTASPPLSQFCLAGETCVTETTRTAASGEPLVNFLRGDRSNEGTTAALTRPFRARAHVLGDIVSSEAVYVKSPRFDYADPGYTDYKLAQANRMPMVYVGANDGMLHAFAANTGEELWAYIPSMLMPNLYKLADKFYGNRHQFYVDGSPAQGDIYAGGAWRTIIVGGLNRGGRGYYALDVTNPESPVALWEFTDPNLGYTYGRPEITKLKDGTWVVLVTSGYNNVNPGDGVGRLYVLNAYTGALIRSISTGVGSTSTVAGVCTAAPCPSGLAQIRAWVDNTRYDNTAQRVYGGDLFGNVWRFDINGDIGDAGYEATLLATLRDASGSPQPLMARPELGRVATYPVVFVGTGRYLGASDLSTTSQQTLYAIKDRLTSTQGGVPRNMDTYVQQRLTSSTCGAGNITCTSGETVRTGTSNAVNFAIHDGWFVDLPSGTGERATTDPQLALGTLVFTTNILDPSACSVGGSSYLNFFDYATGAPVSTANGIVSVRLGDALATRAELIRTQDGTMRSLIRMSDNTWQNRRIPRQPTPGSVRRTSWREILPE